MTQTTNISLGGYLFNIENGAYETLKNYLHEIEQRCGALPNKDEIVKDIEIAMAEKLRERFADKELISESEIRQLVEIMGSPSDIAGDKETPKETVTSATPKGQKHLFRDTDNKMIAGVCSGLAAYFGVDATLVRIIAVVSLLFFNGVILVIYIILWIVVPPARSTNQKMQMQGEPFTVSSIKETIQEGKQKMTTSASSAGPMIIKAIVIIVIAGLVASLLGMLIFMSLFTPWV